MENQTQVKLNRELAQMLKGGVIMDVTTPEQAKIAEAAGACAVMALERIPADIRAAGGVSRMSDPKMIKGIQNAVSIPVMASAESVILQKHRFCRQSKSTTSTKAKSSLRLMMYTTSTRLHSKFRLFAVQRIWAKLCGELQKVQP